MNIEHYYDTKGKIWGMSAVNDNGKNMGHLYYLKQGDNFKLCYLFVSEDGCGTGRDLLEKLISIAEENHVTLITGSFIPVPETSQAAQHLYESVGFRINPKTKQMCKQMK